MHFTKDPTKLYTTVGCKVLPFSRSTFFCRRNIALKLNNTNSFFKSLARNIFKLLAVYLSLLPYFSLSNCIVLLCISLLSLQFCKIAMDFLFTSVWAIPLSFLNYGISQENQAEVKGQKGLLVVCSRLFLWQCLTNKCFHL